MVAAADSAPTTVAHMSDTPHVAAHTGKRGYLDWQEEEEERGGRGLDTKRGQSNRSNVLSAQRGDIHVLAVSASAAEPGTVTEPITQFPAWEEFMRHAAGRCVLVDGGLATELEKRGADLNDPLWSAKCLLDETQAGLIREVSGEERGGGGRGGSEREGSGERLKSKHA